MANFYNPYMKGPDFGQGVNQWMAQKRAMMAAMAQMAAGIPPTGAGETQEALKSGQEFYDPAAVTDAPNSSMVNQSNPLAELMKQQGAAPSPPEMTPTGGNMAGSPLNIRELGGEITPKEIQMIMQIFQAKKMMGTKGFGGI